VRRLKRYADDQPVFGMNLGHRQSEIGQQANNEAGCTQLDSSGSSHIRPFLVAEG
jgi:hypothetical protein